MGLHHNTAVSDFFFFVKDIDENIYNTKTPTLFVVGQHANSCHLDTLEDIREKLRVDTGLVVVGGADDHLRMSRTKKKSCNVTQTLVDRCIVVSCFWRCY